VTRVDGGKERQGVSGQLEPPVLVHTVENGIDVNPVECIFWLPELEQALDLTLSG